MDVLTTALHDLGDEIARELERRQSELTLHERRKTEEDLDAARVLLAVIKQGGATRKRKHTGQRTAQRTRTRATPT
jgi:hypothetical protein